MGLYLYIQWLLPFCHAAVHACPSLPCPSPKSDSTWTSAQEKDILAAEMRGEINEIHFYRTLSFYILSKVCGIIIEFVLYVWNRKIG